MKILFINYEFPPIGGGGGNANAYIFDEYAKQDNLHIDLVTSSSGPTTEVYDYADNIRIHRLSVGKKALHLWTQVEILKYLWFAHRYVGRLIKEGEYDVCHAFFGFPSGLIAYLRRREMPYLVSLRGSDVPGFNIRFSKQYVVLKPIFRRIWSNADAVVANSIGLKELANKFMPNLPIPVIPNGIDTNEFFPSTDRRAKKLQILCVSRLIQRKGVQHLVEAMPSIIKAHPTVKLTIIGEGDYYLRLVERVRELEIRANVTFRGLVPHSELAAEYRMAKLYVQPSFYEGMSNTVLEAMASGLPIIVSGKGGNEELYRDNATIVPYGEPQAIADAVSNLLDDQSKLDAMGRESLAIASELSWQSVAESYLNLYESIS